MRLRSTIGLLECSQQFLNVGSGLLAGCCDTAQSADDADAREEDEEHECDEKPGGIHAIRLLLHY